MLSDYKYITFKNTTTLVNPLPVRGLNYTHETQCVKSAHSFSDWFFKNLMCNIVMFMPCGFLVPLFVRRNKWWYVLLFGSLLSLVIELTQWAIGIGIFDIDDVILNSFGTMIGFGIYKLIYSVALKNSLD